MFVTGAEAIIKSLEEEKVEIVFGYPGGAVLSVYDALARSRINHILVRSEQAAAHAANGYARVTGKPGVCLATSGPGSTNLVTGIANAYMDSIPLVVITGQVATTMVGTDAFQEVDITGITIPITKHNYLVKNVKDLPRIIKQAFHIAVTGRPGPVLIDIPKNITDEEVYFNYPDQVNLRGYKPTYYGHPTQIKEAARLINQSKRPVIYAGGGIISANAAPELREMAEKTGIPVTTTLMGIGSFPQDNPLSLGMLGLHGTAYANFAVSEADLIIGLGVRFDDRVTGNIDKFAPFAKIIHIDIDPAEIGKNVRVDLPIVGHLKNVLQALSPLLENKSHPKWLEQINQWKSQHSLSDGGEGEGVSPIRIIKEVSRLTKNDRTIVTTDVGQHQMWVAQHYSFDRPRSFLSSGGLGTMGYGLPAAVGAQLAAPEARVITFTGDGSFQMNMAELATAAGNDLPLKVIVMNNSCLGMVRQLQHFYCQKNYTAVEMKGSPDFVQLAKAFGAKGLRIAENSQVTEVLAEALNHHGLAVVDCVIKPEQNVYPMVLTGSGLKEMVFTD